MNKLEWAMLLLGIIIVMVFFSIMNESIQDSVYLTQPIGITCPGVPELENWNTSFFTETRVNQCSFGGYCSDNIDNHKTVLKMKERCKELQNSQVKQNGS